MAAPAAFDASKIRIDVPQANVSVVFRSLFPPANTAAWFEGLLASGYSRIYYTYLLTERES